MSALAKERFAICRACEHLVPNTKFKFLERCAKCGCVARAKVQPRSATCPIGKW